MKFLLVAYNDSDGVGQTAVNLNTTLNNLGHKSKIVLLNQSIISKNIFKIKRSLTEYGRSLEISGIRRSTKTLNTYV